MGVARGADAFMTSIEAITSQTRVTTVTIRGKKKRFHTRVWNDTVANLTLMALGSSAPEILLSIIEAALMSPKGNFFSGELGPSTIIGSAAFNLMVITGVCVIALPDGETRTIKHLQVFLVTATFSVFAYVWMVIVLVAWTPNVITIAEGVLTLALMLVLVVIAFLADKGLLSPSGAAYASRSLKLLSIKSVKNASGSSADLVGKETTQGVPELNEAEIARYLKALELGQATDEEAGGSSRSAAMEAIPSPVNGSATSGGSGEEGVAGLGASKVRSLTAEEIANGIKEQQQKSRPRSRMDHRAKALRALTGGGRKNSKGRGEGAKTILEDSDVTLDDVERACFIGFVTSIITVTEGDDEHAVLTVARHGCLDGEVRVRYATREGTAKAASDYIHQEGVLTFAPGEKQALIKVPIVDDDEIEDDEEFYVTLSDPETDPPPAESSKSPVTCRLAGPKLHAESTVLIKDDDVLPGTIGWKSNAVRCIESDGFVTLTVERKRGHNGEVSVKYDTKQKQALEGIDYMGQHGVLTFAHAEMSKTVTIEIVNDNAYEKDETFLCVLSEPSDGVLFREDTDGRGELDICTVTIESDGGTKTKIDRVMMLLHVDRQKASVVGSAWREQLCSALTLEEDQRSVINWFLHVVMLPWKLLFGACPPPDLCGGWALFAASLFGIMFQVILIGDLAQQLGCEIGIRDSVTAITFVAFGTSLPDLFASMQAARDDPSADNSIGNVTGSNSVNVFLGLGLPWVLASIYWAAQGPTAEWQAEYPNIYREYPNGARQMPSSNKTNRTAPHPLCAHGACGRLADTLFARFCLFAGVYVVCAGSLAFSVVVFSVVAILTIAIILLRRFALTPAQELGGNRRVALGTAGFMFALYFVYLAFSILRAEEVVEAFNSFLQSVTANPDCA